MALNKADLKTLLDATIFTNANRGIKAANHNNLVTELIDSLINLIELSDQTLESNILFKKQATVQGATISFTATPTFNFDSGNVQKMIVTGTVTSLSISNELDSGSYRIFLQQDGTGGHAVPTPDASFGTITDNSVSSAITAADGVNIYDIAIDPDGTTYYSIETITA